MKIHVRKLEEKQKIKNGNNNINEAFESISKINKNIKESFERIKIFGLPVHEYFKYNMMISPPIFDFLKKLKVELGPEEIAKRLKNNSLEKRDLYMIYTRKTRGSKFLNPTLYVDGEMFKAVKIILKNNKSSVVLENNEIRFYPKDFELRIWGFSTYIKRGTPRYDLCEYMFGNKKCPMSWEFEDLVEVIGESLLHDDLSDLKDKIRGKIRHLNEDIKKSIGIENFIIEEGGKFVVNPLNIPKIN